MINRYPLRWMIPALMLLFASVLTILYAAYQNYQSARAVEALAASNADYLGAQLSADLEEEWSKSGQKAALRKLIRYSTRPDVRLTILLDHRLQPVFVSRPEFQGMALDAIPDFPPLNRLREIQTGPSGEGWLSPSGDTLWALSPVMITTDDSKFGPVSGLLLLAFDVAEAKGQARHQLADQLVVFLSGMCALSFLLALVLRHVLVVRVERLARAAHDVMLERGTMEGAIEGGDEIAALARDLAEIGQAMHLRSEALERANVALIDAIRQRDQAEAEVRLAASVFGSTNDAIVITDLNNVIVDVNPAFTAVTGYTREEAIGNTPSILSSGRHDRAFYEAMWSNIRQRGRWRGEIWNRRKNGEIYAELLDISVAHDDFGQPVHHIAVFTDISNLKDIQQRLEKMAHFDELTGLSNRAHLTSRLFVAMEQAQRQSRQLAVIFLDLDHFKQINDSYGHHVGDQVLVAVAQRLKQTLRIGDTAARLGGDEFVMLVGNVESGEEFALALDRIQEAVAEPIRIDDEVFRMSASLGVTFYPADAADSDTLLRHADQAMYAAKQNGRGCYQYFDLEQDRAIHERSGLQHRVARALQAGEFELHYQPKLDLVSGRIYGAEALLRWRDPEHGLVMPGEFLPQLEHHDLIVDIGHWVIREALRQLAAWQADGLDLVLSVNIAARHLQRRDFVEQLRAALAARPEVVASRLELEILESAALGDTEHVRDVIARCQAMGLRFALDDFGSGYASLAYLKEIPAQVMKVDQSFVRDMLSDANDLALVKSIVGLAATFERELVAEGVETYEHCRVLLEMGCHLVQGYGIARPMPEPELRSFCATYVLPPEAGATYD